MLLLCDGIMQPLKTVLGWEDDIVSKVQARKPEFDLRTHVRKKYKGGDGYGRTGKCGGSGCMM